MAKIRRAVHLTDCNRRTLAPVVFGRELRPFGRLRQAIQIGPVVCGLRETKQELFEKFPRRLAGESQRGDTVRRHASQQQADDPSMIGLDVIRMCE